jgi:hypothetical protein
VTRRLASQGLAQPAVVACFAVVLAHAFVTPLHARAAAAPPGTFLVMPFENSGDDPALTWLSACLAQHTGEHLRSRGAGVVDDEDRAVLLDGQGIPPGASLTLASVLELGRTMRARPSGMRPDRLILGRFTVQEGGVSLSGRVIDLETESAKPWITREGRLKDLLEVHAGLADALERDASIQRRGGGTVVEPPLLAFETYCRALGENDARKRLALLRRAIQEYPGYPLASFQAALLLARGEQWREASETLAGANSAAHPYEADFHLLEAVVALALRNPDAAAQAARRSLERVQSARAHVVLGRALVALGDANAARAELDRAVAIDPTEPEIEDLRKALAAGATTTGRTQ